MSGNIKKKMIISIIAIVVIAIIVIGGIFLKNILEEYNIEEVNQFSYFTLYQNQKYGVIDTKGNIIVEAKYDKVAIPNPSKPVFICYYDYNSQEDSYSTKVYNEKNEEIFSQYEQVLPLMFQDSTAKVPYEKSVLKYKENGKYGIMDFEGKKITKAQYTSIESLLYKEGYLIVEENDKYGIINGKGKRIVKSQYDTITADGYYKEDSKYKYAGFIVSSKTETGYQYGYINFKGKVILEAEYNEVDRVTEISDNENAYLVAFKNGQAGLLKNKKYILQHQYEDIEYNKNNKLFTVQKASRQGIVDLEGKQIIETEYDNIFISQDLIIAEKDGESYTFDINGNKQDSEVNNELIKTENENYFISIEDNEKYGVLNKNNEKIIDNNYQYIEYVFGDLFIATKNGKSGVIDATGNTKINLEYDVVQRLENTNIIQAIKIKENVTKLYNKNLEEVSSLKNAVVYNKNNYIKVVSDTDMQYLDKEGNIISSKEILEQNNIYAFKKDEKWGFVDKEGNIIIEPKYDMVTEFNSYGFAGIKQGNKWGVIDTTGNIVLEPTYNINWQEPEFIGKYCKVNFGYGLDYYTDKL